MPMNGTLNEYCCKNEIEPNINIIYQVIRNE